MYVCMYVCFFCGRYNLLLLTLAFLFNIFTYFYQSEREKVDWKSLHHSRFISEGVAEASQIFL
jgi:hypothetical protein